MKISRSYIRQDDEYSSSNMEITEQTVFNIKNTNYITHRCSRKLFPLETSSHRCYGKIRKDNFTMPRKCQIAGEEYSEMAFSVLQYQLKDRQIRKTHFNNLRQNLERRIQIAKAKGNRHLVALLDREFGELNSLES